MKRIVKFQKDNNGRNKIYSISAPISISSLDMLSNNVGYIDNFDSPAHIEGKKTELFYNEDTNLVEVEYSDITFEDLDPNEKIKHLKDENTRLEETNKLLQKSVIELYELLNGSSKNSNDSITEIYSNNVISNTIEYDKVPDKIKDKVKDKILSKNSKFFDKNDDKEKKDVEISTETTKKQTKKSSKSQGSSK